MKLITRDSDYAIRALCFIAKNNRDIVPVGFLVKELGVPGPFLRKLLQVLQSKGVLKSFKGQGGGFSLKKLPRDIFITDVMRIFQGTFCLNECFLRKLVCPHTGNCPLRKRITKIESYVIRELSSINIQSLIKSG